MAQNVADHLHVGSGVNLPAGMAVTEGVSANHRGGHSGSTGVQTDAMTNGAAGDRLVWHSRRQKNPPRLSVGRTFRLKIGRQGPCNRSQQREVDCDAGLRPPDVQSCRLPIHVLETQAQHLASS